MRTVFLWTTAPEHAESLYTLAKANDATLAASGAQDVFWFKLATTLLDTSHRVDRVAGHCMWNVDDYGPQVANHLLVGQSKEAFDTHVTTFGWPEFVARQTLEALVTRLGMTVASIKPDLPQPSVANCKSGCHWHYRHNPYHNLGRPPL